MSDKFSKTLVDLCNVQQEIEKVLHDHKSTWDTESSRHDSVRQISVWLIEWLPIFDQCVCLVVNRKQCNFLERIRTRMPIKSIQAIAMYIEIAFVRRAQCNKSNSNSNDGNYTTTNHQRQMSMALKAQILLQIVLIWETVGVRICRQRIHLAAARRRPPFLYRKPKPKLVFRYY